MRYRLYRVIKKYSVIFLIGLLYLIFILITGIMIPCPIKALTGLSCPGCGATRMIVSLARLDLASAFRYNPFLLMTSPVILACIIIPEVQYVRRGSSKVRSVSYIMWGILVLAIAFGIVRNIF